MSFDVFYFWYLIELSFLSRLGSRVVLKSPIKIRFSLSLVSGSELKRFSKNFVETVSLWEGAYRHMHSKFSSFSLSFMCVALPFIKNDMSFSPTLSSFLIRVATPSLGVVPFE